MLLCDAGGTLFLSEEPAFVSSARVTQDFADRFGLTGDFSAETLRLTITGKNFPTTAEDLLAAAGVRAEPAELERWVDREKAEVTEYLAQALHPQPDVLAALVALGRRHELAAVSSSALSRLAACFTARSGLDEFFPVRSRFSAEDSLPVPTSKPDRRCVNSRCASWNTRRSGPRVEDSVTGARSALSAGLVTIGIVQFVPVDERKQRERT